MCGIFGFTREADLPLRIKILRDNLERGNAAFSVFHTELNIRCVIDNPTWEDVRPLGVEVKGAFMGHFQSPTAQRGPDRHPFQWREWFVAHNGVIHNWRDIVVEMGTRCYETDSSILPFLLWQYKWTEFQSLEGTFACWAYNYNEKQTYLFRWVNPLYYNATAFSSCPFPGGEELEEGSVITWPQNKEVARFTSPYHPYRQNQSGK